MPFDLRPLTLAELLDRSFMLYRRHFRLFVGLMAIPAVFTLLLAAGAELFQAAVGQSAEPFADADPMKVLAGVLVGGGAFILIFTGYVVSYMVTLGATTLAVSELYVGRTVTIVGVYSRMREQVGRLLILLVLIGLRLFGIFIGGTLAAILVTALLAAALAAAAAGGAAVGPIVGLGALLGTLVMMLACTVFSLRYAVAVPALALENVTAGESIRRSVALTRGNRVKAGVLVLFAMVVTYGALLILQGPFMVGALMAGADTRMALWLNLLGAVAGSIGGAITGPVVIIALALLYYDIRIRNEGLDLQLMMANLDQKADAPTSAA